ncbi:hypothetical protein BCU59_18395 [Vibrio cyclitrophicus]|nr:hypothetical protein BCU59_18395 [Vibrio cyclitrophicus]
MLNDNLVLFVFLYVLRWRINVLLVTNYMNILKNILFIRLLKIAFFAQQRLIFRVCFELRLGVLTFFKKGKANRENV